MENKEEKIKDLFSDEVIKGESQKFFSFETHDGKFGNINNEIENETGNLPETEIGKDYSVEESHADNYVISEETVISENKGNEYFSVSHSEKWSEKHDSEMPEIRKNNFSQAEKTERYDNRKRDNEGYKVGTFERHEGRQVDYNILGQIFDTYILVGKNDELEIYDQHIIHERILYEELKDKFYSRKLESQQLLIPQKIEVTAVEKSIISENQEIFSEFGFDIDQFSDNEILLRAVPAFDFREDVKNVLQKLLEDLKNENEIKDLRENIIISMSCKGAVKAGQKLDMGEMRNMVRRLHEVGKYTCPHGRPIIVKLTKNDLDKMFGRKK